MHYYLSIPFANNLLINLGRQEIVRREMARNSENSKVRKNSEHKQEWRHKHKAHYLQGQSRSESAGGTLLNLKFEFKIQYYHICTWSVQFSNLWQKKANSRKMMVDYKLIKMKRSEAWSSIAKFVLPKGCRAVWVLTDDPILPFSFNREAIGGDLMCTRSWNTLILKLL